MTDDQLIEAAHGVITADRIRVSRGLDRLFLVVGTWRHSAHEPGSTVDHQGRCVEQWYVAERCVAAGADAASVLSDLRSFVAMGGRAPPRPSELLSDKLCELAHSGAVHQLGPAGQALFESRIQAHLEPIGGGHTGVRAYDTHPAWTGGCSYCCGPI